MRSFPRKGILLMTGIILLSGTSCIDDIELNLDPEQYSRLVVQGSVTDADSAQTVILTNDDTVRQARAKSAGNRGHGDHRGGRHRLPAGGG
jgi:hypothetical protein